MRYPWNHLAVLLLAALPAAAGPGEQASLPYALVYRLAMQAAADNGSNEVATIRFTSALPGVTPDAVELRIDSSAGPIPLQLGGDGTCRVPLSDALLRENPPIRSNQPKGSMRVTAAIKRDIPLAPDGSVGYRELMNPLTLSRRMKEKMQDTADLIWAKHLESLVVHIEDHGGRRIAIHASGGRIEVLGDPFGLYQVPYREELIRENPRVVLPGRQASYVGLPGMEAMADEEAAQATWP